jgi:hypothetical protein
VSGPHDFAVRLDALRLRASLRPSHPAPNVRDDREAPLLEERGTAETSGVDLPDIASPKFSAAALDKFALRQTGFLVICPTGKSGEIESNQVQSNCSVFVIPGHASSRGPGIHTSDRGYGFRACATRIPE